MSDRNNIAQPHEPEHTLNWPPSDGKMDTCTGSFLSQQNAPRPVLSSDFEEKDLHNELIKSSEPLSMESDSKMADIAPRLSQPLQDMNSYNSLKHQEHLNGVITNMSNLKLHSLDRAEISKQLRPNHLGISPPKFSSILTSTTDHPLMGLGSPDTSDNYPDVVPVRSQRTNYNLDDEPSNADGNSLAVDSGSLLDFYQGGPQRNTSKNNLYFSDNFTTTDNVSNTSYTSPPDVAKVHADPQNQVLVMRRKIIPKFREREISSPQITATSTPQRVLGRVVGGNVDESAILKYVEERNKKLCGNGDGAANTDVEGDSMRSGATKWCESLTRGAPTFDLPIQMSTNIGGAHTQAQEPESPGLTASTPEERSTYQTLLDPYTGSVALRHTAPSGGRVSGGAAPRRKIVAVLDSEDCCSLDSDSVCSLQSEEAAGAPPHDHYEVEDDSDDDTKQNSLSEYSETIPEYSAAEERDEERAWLKVALPSGGFRSCDMKVIEPYKRVLSHGGYETAGAGGAAVIVLSACHLPDSARPDYHYVMDNLFLYVLWTLERLVTDEYALVYLHGAAARWRLPTLHWLHECYKLIDRRLRKNLKRLYVVHPTFWFKSLVLLTKPFVSSKFFRKIVYVKNLKELMDRVPVEPNAIPDYVREYDAVKL